MLQLFQKFFFSLPLLVMRHHYKELYSKTTQSYLMLHLPAIQSTPTDASYKVIVNTDTDKILQARRNPLQTSISADFLIKL